MIEVVLGLFWRDGQLFLQRRPQDASVQPEAWELPGGKVEPGEAPEEALRRELREELQVEVRVGAKLGAWTHAYPQRTVHLTAWEVEAQGPLGGPLAWGWFRPGEWEHLPLLEGTRRLLDDLR